MIYAHHLLIRFYMVVRILFPARESVPISQHYQQHISRPLRNTLSQGLPLESYWTSQEVRMSEKQGGRDPGEDGGGQCPASEVGRQPPL